MTNSVDQDELSRLYGPLTAQCDSPEFWAEQLHAHLEFIGYRLITKEKLRKWFERVIETTRNQDRFTTNPYPRNEELCKFEEGEREGHTLKGDAALRALARALLRGEKLETEFAQEGARYYPGRRVSLGGLEHSLRLLVEEDGVRRKVPTKKHLKYDQVLERTAFSIRTGKEFPSNIFKKIPGTKDTYSRITSPRKVYEALTNGDVFYEEILT